MRNLLCLPVRCTQTGGRDSSLKYPDLSLHSYHYAPHKKEECRLDERKVARRVRACGPNQNHAILASLPYLLATIPLSPTGS